MTADVSMEKKFMNSEYPEITHEDSKNSTDSFNANIIVISNPFSGSFVSFNNNYNSSNDYKQNDSIDNPSPKKEKIMMKGARTIEKIIETIVEVPKITTSQIVKNVYVERVVEVPKWEIIEVEK